MGQIRTSPRLLPGLWGLALLAVHATGCSLLAPPLAITVDRLVPLYPEPRAVGCPIEVYPAPPATPYRAFAHITVRGDEARLATMQAQLQEEACRLGADAVIVVEDHTPVSLEREVNREWMIHEAPHLSSQEYPLSLLGTAVVYKGPEAHGQYH